MGDMVITDSAQTATPNGEGTLENTIERIEAFLRVTQWERESRPGQGPTPKLQRFLDEDAKKLDEKDRAEKVERKSQKAEARQRGEVVSEDSSSDEEENSGSSNSQGQQQQQDGGNTADLALPISGNHDDAEVEEDLDLESQSGDHSASSLKRPPITPSPEHRKHGGSVGGGMTHNLHTSLASGPISSNRSNSNGHTSLASGPISSNSNGGKQQQNNNENGNGGDDDDIEVEVLEG